MLQANAAKPARRLATKYRFDDEDMDLFFVAALGWGPTGGLDVANIPRRFPDYRWRW